MGNMTKQPLILTKSEIVSFVSDLSEGDADWRDAVLNLVDRVRDRGDGVAFYRNEDLGHPGIGEIQVASFGSPAAQLETDTPPDQLPDIGGAINWRFRLYATIR